ncbi:MAG: efflux RND transporter periplasmic adaptor subunit [Devosia sp.]|nr:efflux RND transporter periplasmic adaptor subunit [Devosia sp.]
MTMALPLDSAVARPARPATRGGKRPARRWLTAAAVVLMLGIGTGGYWYAQQGQTVVPVSTVTVTRSTLEETVLASGTLEASSLVSVGAQVSGIIKSVDVALGDEVRAGDVLTEIDSLDQENALKAAQAALANIEAQKTAETANLAKYQKALDRAATLGAGDLISQADYDTAEANVAASQAQLASFDAQIEQAALNVSSAQLDLDRTTVTAPSDGTVVAVLVDQGQTVNASAAAPTIVKIANLDTMQIKAKISEADVSRVKAGQNVYFTVLGDPDNRIEATLKSVEPAPTSIEGDTTSTDTAIYYNGIFEVPNADHALRIAMTAQVTIILDEAANVLTLPTSALGTAGPDGSYTVSVLDPATGATTPHQVTVGLDDKVTAEITAGLSEGDKVVTAGTAKSPATPTATSGGMGGPPMGF